MACKVFRGPAATRPKWQTEQEANPLKMKSPAKGISFSSRNGCVYLQYLRLIPDGRPFMSLRCRDRVVCCRSLEPRAHNAKQCPPEESRNFSRDNCKEGHSRRSNVSELYDDHFMARSRSARSTQGLAEALRNDAEFVNQRAQNDILLLSRGISKLNSRARHDVAFLGSEFLKLDARARKDTEAIDLGVKKRAAHLSNIAKILKEKAKADLKRAADQHWSDGALEADLRRADFCARRRAMEDAFMALKFLKDIHHMMANNLKDQSKKDGSFSINTTMGFITLEKNGKAVNFSTHEVSSHQITAIEDAYSSMASALSETDGIDYTDPEELELLITALIDLDAMDGKTTVSLLAECSSSPNVNTRKALANALASAPSIWILGNAGMGALQRLSQDSNPAVAAAASRAIDELKQQWELEEGDSLRFVMNPYKQNDASRNTNFDME